MKELQFTKILKFNLVLILYLTSIIAGAQDPCNPTYQIAGLGQSYLQTYVPDVGGGAWNSTSYCGNVSNGIEKVYLFNAPYTGTYWIDVDVHGSVHSRVSYLWKQGPCDSTMWNCIGYIQNNGVYGSMYWTPGVYYVLLKTEWEYNNATHDFYIFYEPNAPVINSSVLSSSQILLNWNDVEGETGYKIYRADNLGGSYNLITTHPSDSNTFIDNGLAPDEDYCYKIIAYNNDAESVFSNEACATTYPLPPSAPTNLIATPYSYSEISLTWDDVTNETGYSIYRAMIPGGIYSLIDSTSTDINYYYDNGLSENTLYCYRVRSFNPGGESYFSNEDCAVTISSGLDDIKDNERYVVYPNPASGVLTIESLGKTDWMMSIYSIQGILLLYQDSREQKISIDISTLFPGMYLLKLENEKELVVKKFVKE